jgi:hypothetical protein
MIKKETIIILGAGANKPYGFPLGSELRDSVIKKQEDFWLRNSSLEIGFSSIEYAVFTDNLAYSGYASVDAYLENNDRWLDLGKAAIALDLLGYEYSCEEKLFPPKQPADHWYETLWSRLRTPTWEEFKSNAVRIITFNYDRSLEHYLVKVLCNNYKIGSTTAMRGLSELPILHVHGDLGEYITVNGQIDFGERITQSRYEAAKQRIKIIHEDMGGTKELNAARKYLEQAERILFIGFGYHSSNMAKLGLSEWVGINGLGINRVFGTHRGIKSNAWRRICQQYGFCHSAQRQGRGSISEFINECLE